MSEELNIVLSVYRGLINMCEANGDIPVYLRPNEIIGTVQDDPFDCWIESCIKNFLPPGMEVFHSGKLTTPDLIIRNRYTGSIVGFEIKKLIQRQDGKDSRGLTMDYNSCLPCGRTLIKCGGDTLVIPCYYIYALLNPQSTEIITLVIVNGDFINYDFNLHKEAKYSNFTEYGHGPYQEGSVRHRKMYTYPNPLNTRLDCFYHHKILVAKKSMINLHELACPVNKEIVRTDKYGNSFYYYIINEISPQTAISSLRTITDIFSKCKLRNPKERVAYIPEIPKI